jgi:hypothetical protein
VTCWRIEDPGVLLAALSLGAFLLAVHADAGEAGEAAATVAVDADFPGGNSVLERIEGEAVYLHQDLRDTQGDWFWWHFRVRGAAGRTLTFHFTKSNVIGVRGPALSTDGGKAWTWLGKEAVKGSSFRYSFPAEAQEVRFCFAIPYFEANLRAFLKPYADHPSLKLLPLSRTRKGREAERLAVGKLGGQADHRVLITCRHHCCESMASYSAEGLIEAALADADDGRWFREHVEMMIIPFVDKDGVEDGDQGKNRKPHDHNRDYAGESLYPEVKAIREIVPAWSGGKLRIALDLHCPHIRGPHNEVIYQVGAESPAMWEQQCAFGKILESVRTGPLPYHASDNLPFGKGWNTEKNYGSGKSYGRWAGGLPGMRLASSIEIPYANAAGAVVTAESARAFGRDLAKAIRQYLEP